MGAADAGDEQSTTGWPVHGIAGFVTAWREWLSTWETWTLGSIEIIDVDEDRVLVLFSVLARSKTHQVEIPMDGANLLTFRGGTITRLELFFDRAKALEAAGLNA